MCVLRAFRQVYPCIKRCIIRIMRKRLHRDKGWRVQALQSPWASSATAEPGRAGVASVPRMRGREPMTESLQAGGFSSWGKRWAFCSIQALSWWDEASIHSWATFFPLHPKKASSPPHMPRVWLPSPVRAHRRINQWVRKCNHISMFLCLSLSPPPKSVNKTLLTETPGIMPGGPYGAVKLTREINYLKFNASWAANWIFWVQWSAF